MNKKLVKASSLEGDLPPLKPVRSLVQTILNCVIALGVLFLFFGCMFLAVQDAGSSESAKRAGCGNNQKQIAIAILNYHDFYRSLPPAYTVDAEGKPLHSWRTLILPFMEQQQFYKQVDLAKPWNDPKNMSIFEQLKESPYRCPSARRNLPAQMTTYLAVISPESVFSGATPRLMREIKDGMSQTVLVVEVPEESAVPWYEPRDTDLDTILSMKAKVKNAVHNNGRSIVLVDGSAYFVRNQEMTDEIWKRLIDIDGGEPVEIP